MIRPYRILKLLAVFLWEFTVSVFRVARLVLSPGMRFTPAAFRFPLALTSDRQITLFVSQGKDPATSTTTTTAPPPTQPPPSSETTAPPDTGGDGGGGGGGGG